VPLCHRGHLGLPPPQRRLLPRDVLPPSVPAGDDAEHPVPLHPRAAHRGGRQALRARGVCVCRRVRLAAGNRVRRGVAAAVSCCCGWSVGRRISLAGEGRAAACVLAHCDGDWGELLSGGSGPVNLDWKNPEKFTAKVNKLPNQTSDVHTHCHSQGVIHAPLSVFRSPPLTHESGRAH